MNNDTRGKTRYCPVVCKALYDASYKQLGENEVVQFCCLAYREPISWCDYGILKHQKCIDNKPMKDNWRNKLKQEVAGDE